MAFMHPFAYHGAYWIVETSRGDFCIPRDDLAEPHPSREEMVLYAPEGMAGIDADSITAMTLKTGWYGRLSAPGYMDCTDWEWADTEAELLESLRGDEPDDDDEDSADDAPPVSGGAPDGWLAIEADDVVNRDDDAEAS